MMWLKQQLPFFRIYSSLCLVWSQIQNGLSLMTSDIEYKSESGSELDDNSFLFFATWFCFTLILLCR